MNEEYHTYKKFSDIESANELIELLNENSIDYKFEDNSVKFDPSFAYNELNNEFRIKLRQQDFETVTNLVLRKTANEMDHIDPEYYLFTFSNEELIEIIEKPDEWSEIDYLLAQKILKTRGLDYSSEDLNDLKRSRIITLAESEKSSIGWIIAGYIFAIGGGILGIMIGWFLFNNKKTLPNGELVYTYTDSDRKNGRIIFVLGIIFLIFWLTIRIYTNTLF